MKIAKAKHYAKVIVAVCKESDWDKTIKGFRFADEIIRKTRELKNYLMGKQVELEDKKDVLKKSFKNNLNELNVKVLLLLVKDNKLSELSDIIEQAEKIYYQKTETNKAEVESVVEMNKKQKDDLLKILESKLKNKVIINNVINPLIQGGLVVRVGDNEIDVSVKGKIDQLKNKL